MVWDEEKWHREYPARKAAAFGPACDWLAKVKSVTDPVALAIFQVHCPDRVRLFGANCAHCVDGDDNTEWPCLTVEVVMEALGSPVPGDAHLAMDAAVYAMYGLSEQEAPGLKALLH